MTTYVVGQVLEDGRKVLEIEDGVPVLSKAPQPAPPAPEPAATQAATPPPQQPKQRKATPRKPGPKSVNTAAVSEKLRTAGTPAAAPPAPQVAPNAKDEDDMATKKKTKAKSKAPAKQAKSPAGQPKYRDLKVALPATRAVGSHQRLTDEQVADLKALRKKDPDGYTWRRLGYIFGTTDTTAQNFCEGKKPAKKASRKK